MRHWLQIATRNWRIRPGRSILGTGAVAMGVGVVVWVTCCYESVERSITEAVLDWIGRSHIIIEPVEGVWAVFGEDVEQAVAPVAGVAATTTRTREYVEGATSGAKEFDRIEISGVLPSKELKFRSYKMLAGRFLTDADERGLLVERLLAEEWKVGVGGTVRLKDSDPPGPVVEFHIVGVIDRRRASVNQAPMVWGRMIDVQQLCKLPGKVKSVDIMLAHPESGAIESVAEEIRQRLKTREKAGKAGEHGTESLEVKTTEAQLQKLSAAKGLLQFIMALLACVVMLTAFFIILGSTSMGVTERIGELGLLRCVGTTRGQVAGLVLGQALAMGLVGTLAGIPLGIVLQWATMRVAPQYVGGMVFSQWGITLGVASGIGTTLLGAIFPTVAAWGVSPVQAVRTQGTPVRKRLIALCGAIGAAALLFHEYSQRSISESAARGFDARSVVGLLTLYLGFGLLLPAAILLLGYPTTRLAGALLKLRRQLLREGVENAPFRSAAICGGWMAGLSLMVGLLVWGDSVKQGWQFPKEFPDAMLYSYEALPLEDTRALAKTPGVGQFTVADDFPFSLSKPSIFRPMRLLDEFSRFLAIDVETGLPMVKLAFLEGTEKDAREKLNRGGFILVTREFSKARKLHLGDKVTLWIDKSPATFSIAGVVASPGLDIAISFFNATTYFQTYSVGAVIGTLGDAERLFHRRYGKLMLINFDLRVGGDTPEPGHAAMPATGERHEAEKRVSPSGRPSFALGPGPIPGDGPEEAVVNSMLAKLGYPAKAFVTARELKKEIDRNIDRVTLLLSVIPLVGLVISALAVANMMAAGVASRSREIALLRAVGLTRSQLGRMILGEALVLGLLGSVMGLTLGIALGHSSNRMTEALSGFETQTTVPWLAVGIGAAITLVLCCLASIVPARRAAQHNVIAGLCA